MAMLQDSTTRTQALEAYYRDLERYSAAPLWTVLHQLLTGNALQGTAGL